MGMKGSGNFLDTGLTRLLETTEIVDASASGQSTEPLMIDEDGGFVYVKGIGSEGKVMTADIPACNGLVHTVDTVLLPLDGDGELDPFQQERIAGTDACLSLFTTLICSQNTVQLLTASTMVRPCNQSDTPRE